MGQAWPGRKARGAGGELTAVRFADALGCGPQLVYDPADAKTIGALHDERRARVERFVAADPARTIGVDMDMLRATLESDRRWKTAIAGTADFDDLARRLAAFPYARAKAKYEATEMYQAIAKYEATEMYQAIAKYEATEMYQAIAKYEVARAFGCALNVPVAWLDVAGLSADRPAVSAAGDAVTFVWKPKQAAGRQRTVTLNVPGAGQWDVQRHVGRYAAVYDELVTSSAKSRAGMEWLSCTELWLLLRNVPSAVGVLALYGPLMMQKSVAAAEEFGRRVSMADLVRTRAPPWVAVQGAERWQGLADALKRTLLAVGAVNRESETDVALASRLVGTLHDNVPHQTVPLQRELDVSELPTKWARWWSAASQGVPRVSELRHAALGGPVGYRLLSLLRLGLPVLADYAYELALPDILELAYAPNPGEVPTIVWTAVGNPTFPATRRLLRFLMRGCRHAADIVGVIAESVELEYRTRYDIYEPASHRYQPATAADALGSARSAALKDLALYGDVTLGPAVGSAAGWWPPTTVASLEKWRAITRPHPVRHQALWLSLIVADVDPNRGDAVGRAFDLGLLFDALPTSAMSADVLRLFVFGPNTNADADRGNRDADTARAALISTRSRLAVSNRAFARSWAAVGLADLVDRQRARPDADRFVDFPIAPLPTSQFGARIARLRWRHTQELQHWVTLAVLLQVRCVADRIRADRNDSLRRSWTWLRAFALHTLAGAYTVPADQALARARRWAATHAKAWARPALESLADPVVSAALRDLGPARPLPPLGPQDERWPTEPASLFDSPFTDDTRCSDPPRSASRYALTLLQAHHDRLDARKSAAERTLAQIAERQRTAQRTNDAVARLSATLAAFNI